MQHTNSIGGYATRLLGATHMANERDRAREQNEREQRGVRESECASCGIAWEVEPGSHVACPVCGEDQ